MSDRLREAARAVSQACISHVDGRDLLEELHPRHTLDIVRRVDGRETRYEGDWLSTLHIAVIALRAALDAEPESSPTNEERAPGKLVRKIRACEREVAAQLVLERALAAAEARGLERAREAIRDPKLRPNGGAEMRAFIDKLDAVIRALKGE